MTVIGIDPGQKGGIAIIWKDGVHVLPMVDITGFITLAKTWRGFHGEAIVFIEKSQAIPGTGSTSAAFSFGQHFGQLVGAIMTLDLVHTQVPPKTWQKVMHAGTDFDLPKARSLQACKRLFPTVNLKATARCKKDHDGICDALLIAEYGRRSLGNAV